MEERMHGTGWPRREHVRESTFTVSEADSAAARASCAYSSGRPAEHQLALTDDRAIGGLSVAVATEAAVPGQHDLPAQQHLQLHGRELGRRRGRVAILEDGAQQMLALRTPLGSIAAPQDAGDGAHPLCQRTFGEVHHVRAVVRLPAT
jgi:hypothetical protein